MINKVSELHILDTTNSSIFKTVKYRYLYTSETMLGKKNR